MLCASIDNSSREEEIIQPVEFKTNVVVAVYRVGRSADGVEWCILGNEQRRLGMQHSYNY